MSRQPKPTAMKIVQGTFRKDRAKDEPKPLTGDIHPPTWIKGRARDIWDQYSTELIRLGLMTELDTEAFGKYCTFQAEWEELTVRLATEGMTYEGDNGLLKTNPLVKIRTDLEIRILQLSDRFGLNPSARVRIDMRRLNGEQDESDIENFLFNPENN
jgi:P27 family predicted phage terminase small subunit